MKPGVYLISEHENKFLATLDEVIYGSDEDQRDLSRDMLNEIRDAAVDLLADDDDQARKKLVIVIVQ